MTHERSAPPKPAALRLAEGGTARKNAVSHRPQPEPLELSRDLEGAELSPPPSLGPDGVECWESIVRPFARLGVITLSDLPAARQMCEHFQTATLANRLLDEEGLIATGSQGQPVPHPANRVATAASAAFLRIAVELGATPAARVRLGLEETKRHSLQVELSERLGFNPRRTSGA